MSRISISLLQKVQAKGRYLSRFSNLKSVDDLLINKSGRHTQVFEQKATQSHQDIGQRGDIFHNLKPVCQGPTTHITSIKLKIKQ